MRIIILALCLFIISSCNKTQNINPQQEYDLWIQRALVLLPNGTTEAMDVLIKDGEIVELVPNPDLKITDSKVEDAKVIDANGNFLMPGFIDAHAHFISLGKNKANLDFLSTTSWEEVVTMVKEKAAELPKGEWIVGRGWHQEKWPNLPNEMIEGFPVHEELSKISPDHPVMLTHASGHGLIANAKAMELAQVNANSKSPDGGVVLFDKKGQPTGIFQENAMSLISRAYAENQKNKTEDDLVKEWLNYLRLAEEECLSQGITTVHDASISFNDALKFKDLANKNELNLRLYAMLSDHALQNTPLQTLRDHVESTREDRFFTNTAVKAFVDGALGSRGAWLIEDYSDLPGYKGENVTPFESLEKTAEIAKELDVQVCIHAIGDRGNREVIDVFEKVAGDEIGERRWRIEHAQHLNPTDIDRIADLNIIASMQTVHCTSDAPYAVKRLGEKRVEEGAYVWQTLLNKNVHIANGTDAPIERINPFENLYAAVTRKRLDSDEAFYPNQKMSREKALEIYTQANAFAGFQEDWKGKIEKGYVADIVILDTNLLTCEERDIPNTKVLYTLVDGQIKHTAE
ncbi:amidohydrolase [Weeksellaceae bacterium KMM 9713]|uniref:Amidohydrolase n=1 Tax=Profundicola chukchiensis TaxID=2961959 RepID=A0A9X4MZY6_9FLAO|nr:amidohydrolase [Profundicola chukchiensis]MDG4946837.1 amidohydrolase [Profundicola chukchiensis]